MINILLDDKVNIGRILNVISLLFVNNVVNSIKV